MTRLRERSLVVALCIAVGWFYAWTVRSGAEDWAFGTEQRDYYNLLIDGYLDGQLHMKVKVPEALLTLRNPYDPQERPAGLGLHDASFYKGRYYIYFGAAPMMLLMLPFRLLTGTDLPLVAAVLVFVFAGYLISVSLWLAVRRRYFSETGTVTVLLGVLVLGLAGVGPVLLRRPDMWELPIAGGYCFAMLTLAAVWRSLHAEGGQVRWFGVAGLSLGLAIASRPTYLITAPLLLAPLLWWWRQERRLPWRPGLWALVPLALIGALMAWHNHARFDDPFQFGQAYQFSLDYESKLSHFRAAYVPFTARAHFFSAAQWAPYFPFIQPAESGAAPEGFTIHRGDVYGILVNFPIAWLALLAPLGLWRRPASERGLLGAWLASVTYQFVAAAGLLLFFFSALARYQMDFAPALMLLACTGLLGLERWLEQVAPPGGRGLARAGWLSAAAFSVVFGLLSSLQFDGLLRENNPQLERKLARQLNRIPAFIERVTGVRHGAVEMTLRLPAGAGSGSETLLTVGQSPVVDRVIVRYPDGGGVQFGFAPHGSPELLSRPLSLDRAADHQLRVTMGSLYPPATHPFFSTRSADEIRRVIRQLRIEVNGEPVVVSHHRADERTGGDIAVGDKVAAHPAHAPFRGTVLEVRRLGNEMVMPAGPAGPFLRLRLAFSGDPDAAWNPLASFGESTSGSLLAVRQVGAGRIRLGVQRSGTETIESQPIGIQSGRTHELVIRFEATGPAGLVRLLLWRDAELVWAPSVLWEGRDVRAISVGKNRVGVTDCAAEFRGTITSAQHDLQGVDPLTASGDLRMRVRLPPTASGPREPLVVTGRTGAGDMLVVEYTNGQSVRFGWDHWGTPMVFSGPITIDFTQPHTLDIAMGSLRTVADATLSGAEEEGRITVAIEGRRVWEHGGIFFPAESAEVVIGRNPIGGTSCGPSFAGEILSAERIPRE